MPYCSSRNAMSFNVEIESNMPPVMRGVLSASAAAFSPGRNCSSTNVLIVCFTESIDQGLLQVLIVWAAILKRGLPPRNIRIALWHNGSWAVIGVIRPPLQLEG